MNEKWYALYTRPKWEKKVAENLTAKQIANYCPLNRVVKQWSDRKKVVFEPLFSSYVFVHVHEKQHHSLREVGGVINLVHWLGKPAIVRDNEIEIIRNFLAEHRNVQIEKSELNIRDRIRVTQGPLMEYEGTVVVVKNNRVKVELASLGCLMYAELERSVIEVLPHINSSLGSNHTCNYAYNR